MPLEFDVSGPSGQEQGVSVDNLVQLLSQDGEQVLNVSPDGLTLQVMGMNGPISVPTEQAWQSYGLQVTGSKPTQADYSQVNPAHRAAIEAIGDEDLKKVYLEGALKKQGIKNPQIMGNGRDFFYFDPQFGKYVALTNNPDWDKSDLAEAGAALPRIAGSIVGGAAGALAGNIPGGMAGAAAGGALGNTAAQGLVGYFNPDAGQVMSQNMGKMAKGAAGNAAVDALSFGVPAGLGKVFGPAVQKGLGSSLARGAGELMESGGRVVNKLAKVADNEIGQNLASSFIPGAAEMSTGGILAQLPGQAIRGTARGLGKLGESEFLQGAAPEMASGMKGLSQKLLRRAPTPSNFTNEFSEGARKAASFLGGKAPGAREVGAEDILGNVGELIGGARGTRKGIFDLYKAGRDIGQNRSEALEAAKAMYADKATTAQRFGEAGRVAGRGIQNLENVGRGLEQAGNSIASGVLKGARAAGYVTGKTGSLVKAAGTVGQPIENRMLTRYGAEEAYDRIKPKRPWQMTPQQDTIKSQLAYSDY